MPTVLKRLDAINMTRRVQAEKFQSGLAQFSELSFQKVTEPNAHVDHPMSARVSSISRDDLIFTGKRGFKSINPFTGCGSPIRWR